MNIMKIMKYAAECGLMDKKNMFFYFSSGAKGEFRLIHLHNVHKSSERSFTGLSSPNSVSILSYFMNIMKIYVGGVFNGFFENVIPYMGASAGEFNEHEKASFIRFIKFGGSMDSRILFAKHWWFVCFRRWQVAKSRRAQKMLRRQMRKTAMTVLEMYKEAR